MGMGMGFCCCNEVCEFLYSSCSTENGPFEDPDNLGHFSGFWTKIQGNATPHYNLDMGVCSSCDLLAPSPDDFDLILNTLLVQKSLVKWNIDFIPHDNGDKFVLFINYIDTTHYTAIVVDCINGKPALSVYQNTISCPGDGDPRILHRKQNDDPSFQVISNMSPMNLKVSLARGFLLCQISGGNISYDDNSATRPDHDDLPTTTFRPLILSVGQNGLYKMTSGIWGIGGIPDTKIEVLDTLVINTKLTTNLNFAACFPDTLCGGMLFEYPLSVDLTGKGAKQFGQRWSNTVDPFDDIYQDGSPGGTYIETLYCNCLDYNADFIVNWAPLVNTNFQVIHNRVCTYQSVGADHEDNPNIEEPSLEDRGCCTDPSRDITQCFIGTDFEIEAGQLKASIQAQSPDGTPYKEMKVPPYWIPTDAIGQEFNITLGPGSDPPFICDVREYTYFLKDINFESVDPCTPAY